MLETGRIVAVLHFLSSKHCECFYLDITINTVINIMIIDTFIEVASIRSIQKFRGEILFEFVLFVLMDDTNFEVLVEDSCGKV